MAASAIAQIDAPDGDAFPTAPAAVVERSWLDGRVLGQATLSGVFCSITAARSIAELRRRLSGALSSKFGLDDLDAATLKDSHQRDLTRTVAREVYEQSTDAGSPFDGISFRSRHGDDLELWAVFERFDEPIAAALSDMSFDDIESDDKDLVEAMTLLNVNWFDD